MEEIEAYAKTLAMRTQCKADMPRSESSTAPTRRSSSKRDATALCENNDVQGTLPSEEESLKRVCSKHLVNDEVKENDPPEQMDTDEFTGLERRRSASEKDESQSPLEGVSIAARRALYEKAVAKSGGTLPISRKAPPKPSLKQMFSTVEIPSAKLTVPITTAVSLRIEAAGVHRSNSSDDDSPGSKEGRPVKERRQTPKKLVRTELLIKRIGSDDDSALVSPLSEKLEYTKNHNNSAHTPDNSCFAPHGTPQSTASSRHASPSVTTVKNRSSDITTASGQADDAEREMDTGEGDEKAVNELDFSGALKGSLSSDVFESPSTNGSNVADIQELRTAHSSNTEGKADMSLKNENMTDDTTAEHINESMHDSEVTDDCDGEIENELASTVETNAPRTMSVEEAKVFDEIDEILNDALGSECNDSSSCSDTVSQKSPVLSPVVQSTETADDTLAHKPTTVSLKSPKKPPGIPEGKRLPHTISFYRLQQQSLTPRRSETEQCTSPEPTTPRRTKADLPLGDKLRVLQEEITTQQNIISQASQALNLCQASSKFVGSSEEIEGERVLLIATQRRLACINEIQRLKRTGDTSNRNSVKGNFKITKIVVQLKQSVVEVVCQSKQGDVVYYFICLLQYGPHVFATQVLSTDDIKNGELLEYDKEIIFKDVAEDFEVVVNVYALKSKKQTASFDKYHTMKDSLRLKLSTKNRKSDPKLFLSPAVSSPGGPDAVRSSSFQPVGSVVLNGTVCGEKSLTLSEVPMSAPLEENITFKTELQAHHSIEHKGFLTLFRDVSDHGAWTRLWCHLRASDIIFWRYPEEEEEKLPMGSINLRHCINKDVELLSLVDCARRNSFKLILVRPLEENDVDSLTLKKHSTVASIKHLFSADTREEAKVWCQKLGAVLSCIRRWDIPACEELDLAQL